MATAKLDVYDEKRKGCENQNRTDKAFEIGDKVIYFSGRRTFGSREN